MDVGRRRDELSTLAYAFDQMRLELERSRAALEQRLEEREELIRLKEEFLAGISHELRTPLNAIIGYTDMLAEEPVSAEGREYLSTVRAQAEHLYRMLADLLTLSSLNTGALPVEVSPVRVPALLARLQPHADQLRAGSPVDVTWDCPGGLPTIETDPLRLEQILTHLLANALKFTPHGKVVMRVIEHPAREADRVRGERHRHRHPAAHAPARLRRVPPGRRLAHPPLRRRRPRPHAGAKARRAAARLR